MVVLPFRTGREHSVLKYQNAQGHATGGPRSESSLSEAWAPTPCTPVFCRQHLLTQCSCPWPSSWWQAAELDRPTGAEKEVIKRLPGKRQRAPNSGTVSLEGDATLSRKGVSSRVLEPRRPGRHRGLRAGLPWGPRSLYVPVNQALLHPPPLPKSCPRACLPVVLCPGT